MGWGENQLFQFIRNISRVLSLNNRWICTQTPRNTEKAVSLTAVPLPAATVSGFSRLLKTTRHTQSREGTDFEVELPRPNPGYNIACYQRCLLNNVDRNSWGNSTDPGCGNIIDEAGNYPYRTECASYGNANIRNAHRIQWESPVTGWPVPNGKGWYWLMWR